MEEVPVISMEEVPQTPPMLAYSVNEFFGTLVQSPVEVWKKHLGTSSYSEHMALDTCYQDLPDLVDTLIEDYMGITNNNDIQYINILYADHYAHAKDYLHDLRIMILDGREKFFSAMPEMQSDIDDILKLISQTLYRLQSLNDGGGLVKFLKTEMGK